MHALYIYIYKDCGQFAQLFLALQGLICQIKEKSTLSRLFQVSLVDRRHAERKTSPKTYALPSFLPPSRKKKEASQCKRKNGDTSPMFISGSSQV